MRRLSRQIDDAVPMRRPPPNRRLRNGLQATAVLAVAAVAVCGPLWLWRAGAIERVATGLENAMIAESANLGLRVDEVRVTGNVETELAEVLAALGVRRGTPILDFDPDSARARIETLPWVAHAAVDRHLPGEIRVTIDEHLPMAIWQHQGLIRMIDTDGGLIDVEPPRRFEGLPIVVGPDAPNHALGLIRLLGAEPDLARRVAAAIRVGGRRWNLEFDNGISVNLPEGDAIGAWRRLATLAREQEIFDMNITVIDLRFYPEKLVIRKAPGDVMDSENNGEET